MRGKIKTSKKSRGTASLDVTYKEVYSQTRDHRKAVEAYCGESKWLTERARGVGNLP